MGELLRFPQGQDRIYSRIGPLQRLEQVWEAFGGISGTNITDEQLQMLKGATVVFQSHAQQNVAIGTKRLDANFLDELRAADLNTPQGRMTYAEWLMVEMDILTFSLRTLEEEERDSRKYSNMTGYTEIDLGAEISETKRRITACKTHLHTLNTPPF